MFFRSRFRSGDADARERACTPGNGDGKNTAEAPVGPSVDRIWNERRLPVSGREREAV